MADNNIIIKITSEAKLDEAQKQLADLTKRAEDLEIEMSQMQTAYENEMAAIKKSNKSREEQADELLKLKQRYRDIKRERKAEAKEVNQSIKLLNDSIKAYKTLHGQSGKVVQQLRAMRERLMEMEDAGEFGTQAFMDLAIAAGKLEDQIGDTQQRIRILASDTKVMDAAMGLGDGLAGGFYVATSGAELFGGELEGLQQAFYKVQAAMSVLSGTQQVYNALQKDSAVAVVFGNGLEEVKQKRLQKSAALERLYNIQKATGTRLTGAHAATTGLWTKAQWKLNAAMAANPIGVVVAGLLVLGAAIYGIIKAYQRFFTDAGKAQAAYADANKKLEETEIKMAVGAEQRAHDRQVQIRTTNDAEEKALSDAKKRNASEIELAAIKSKYAKQRADETKKYADDEIKRNEILQAQAWVAMEAKRDEANAYKEGSKKQKKALEELVEAEQKYYEFVNKITDLENEKKDADKASADAAHELVEVRKQMALEAEQANVELMKEGAAKEIAQINLNYREKLKNIKGNSKEEKELRKALLAQQAKEVAEVQRKYDLQAQQVAIQEQKNLLKAKSQSRGTEADYAQEIALTKAVAEQEAQARIDALNKEKMAEDDYNAQVEAIRLELKDTLKQIDDEEANRKAEYARRLTDIELKEAEARKNALTGAEGVDEQKAILEDYYANRKKQLEENARLEKEEVQRSTKTQEEKDAAIKAIDTQLNADLVELKKEGSQAMLDVDKQYLTELEIAADKAADKVSKAGTTGDKLKALKEQFEAEKALNAEQIKQLDEAWNSGALTDHSEYLKQRYELTKATIDAEVEYQQNALQTIADGFQTALGYMQQISDLTFEALGSKVQAEMDALDEMYTTDWEEAQKDANKKYITEKEYEKKKADLQKKQQKYAKAQALINAGINTAAAIITTLAQLGATPWGIASAAIAGAMGAAQTAIIAAKPLAQYEKGRKGGKGEYAIVGEKGAELMYVPEGASIVPHDKIDKPAEWAKYGVPDIPRTDRETMRYAADQIIMGMHIDYDRMGASVASHLPKQHNVTVKVDRSGVHVSHDGSQHTYLNAKYNGTWS